MNNVAIYFIKAGISLAVLYTFYWLVLQKDTHFWINRAVLLFSVVISMVLPAIAHNLWKTPLALENIPVISLEFGAPASPVSSVTDYTAPVTAADVVAAPADEPFDLWRMLMIIYIAGAFIVFARLIYQAIFLHAVSRLSKKTIREGFTIVSMNTEMVPFSYFNRIYIPASRVEEDSFDSIIAHEKTHLGQWHYIDLFIIEIVSVLQWFNPIIWLYEKSIKEVHEYLADEAVLNTGKNRGRYQALLVNQAMGGPVFILTNQFNQSLIKKRIMMMKKMKTSRAARFKALLLMPLLALLLLAFAGPQTNSQSVSGTNNPTVTGNVTDRTTGKALQGSVIVIQGTTIGTITDTEGNYKIAVNSTGDKLVFSQVGYRTQVIPVGTNTRIDVQMEQDILALDFSGGNKLVMAENPVNKEQKNDVAGKSENAYVVTEELPSYPGGTDALLKYLQANLRYPRNPGRRALRAGF